MAYGKSKEEQIIIARQSQIKTVLDWSIANDKKLRLKELVAITNVFVDYIVEGYSAEIGVRLENIQSYLDNEE
jgi:hypothetical protein